MSIHLQRSIPEHIIPMREREELYRETTGYLKQEFANSRTFRQLFAGRRRALPDLRREHDDRDRVWLYWQTEMIG